jgi:trans-aconitate methyltransferase
MLRPFCRSVEIWQTTYVHSLEGVHSIVEWMKATNLASHGEVRVKRGFIPAFASLQIIVIHQQ